jgi:glycosyltransferase involved in cell wall biosynthesis
VGDFGNVARLERSIVAGPVVRLLRAGRVLVNTDVGEDELRRLGLPPECLCRMALAVDRSRFHPHGTRGPLADRHVLLYAGRHDLRQKRLDLLLDAWDRVAPSGWELVIVGDGPDSHLVEAHAARCRGHIRLLGWVDDVEALLADADAYALPTVAESPGNAVLEGMACALPGLASDIPVLRAMAPAGVRLVENTVAGWEAAARWLTELTPDERREIGALAWTWIDHNTSPSDVDDLAEVLDG